MNTTEKLNQFADSFLDDYANGGTYSDATNNLFNQWVTGKMAEIMHDDTMKTVVTNETYEYINMLYESCRTNKTEDAFFKELESLTGLNECTQFNFMECAQILTNTEWSDNDGDIFEKLEMAAGLIEE